MVRKWLVSCRHRYMIILMLIEVNMLSLSPLCVRTSAYSPSSLRTSAVTIPSTCKKGVGEPLGGTKLGGGAPGDGPPPIVDGGPAGLVEANQHSPGADRLGQPQVAKHQAEAQDQAEAGGPRQAQRWPPGEH